MKTAVLKKDGVAIVGSVEVAAAMRDRMRGLLGRDALPRDHAIYLAPCNCIHTFFMRFPIDLVFLDRCLTVVRIVWNVPASRIVAGGWKSFGVLEMQTGWFARELLRNGDKVELSGG